MERALIDLVWQRAAGTCEYCRLPQVFSLFPFEIDHVIARKHGGLTAASNLALACYYCNSYKGSNIAGVDPVTRSIVRLFHPRRHRWGRHFRWDGPRLVGRTAVGRVTVRVLEINHPDAIALREELIAQGEFPSA